MCCVQLCVWRLQKVTIYLSCLIYALEHALGLYLLVCLQLPFFLRDWLPSQPASEDSQSLMDFWRLSPWKRCSATRVYRSCCWIEATTRGAAFPASLVYGEATMSWDWGRDQIWVIYSVCTLKHLKMAIQRREASRWGDGGRRNMVRENWVTGEEDYRGKICSEKRRRGKRQPHTRVMETNSMWC